MANKKRNFEIEYELWENGDRNTEIENLEKKGRGMYRDEYERLKYLNKVKENLSKTKNIMEFKEKLNEKLNEMKKQIEYIDKQQELNREELQELNREEQSINEEEQSINGEKQIINQELNRLMSQEENLKRELKAGTIKEEDYDKEIMQLRSNKNKNQEKYRENQKKYKENREKYRKNQERYLKYQENFKNLSATKIKVNRENLESKVVELSSKISKCNMACNNLMKGKSWEAIEIKLDNWEEKRFTSSSRTPIRTAEEANATKDNLKVDDQEKPDEEQLNFNEENEETALVPETQESRFQKFVNKHPRFKKIVEFFKDKFSIKTEKEETEETEEKEETTEAHASNTKAEKSFKDELRKIAEKGLDGVKKERFEEMKKEAHARETEKFGKEYADKSYKVEDEGER